MFTHHAQARMQSRSIPYEAVDALLAFGQPRRHCGADVYCLDKRARCRLASVLGKDGYRRLEKSLDSYLVVGDDGAVITVAHRRQRLHF